jgi:hypothetical protein
MCLSQHCRYLMKTFETRQIKLKLTSYCIHPTPLPRRFELMEFWNKGSKRWMCASICNSPSPLKLCLRTPYRPDHLRRHTCRWFCYVVSVPFGPSKKTTGSYVWYAWGSTSCVPRSRSCVPRCPLHVYQLRPELSAANMTSSVPRFVRNWVRRIERYGCTKCRTIGRFLHSFIVFYFIHNYMHTYRIVEWYRQHNCCIMLLSDV